MAEKQADAKFVGMVEFKEFQWGNVTAVGFTREHLQLMMDNLNDKGWVNVEFKKSKAGKPHGMIREPFDPKAAAPKGATNATDQQDMDDLPF